MNMTGNFESAGYFAPIDYCVLVVTLVASMAIGIYFGFFSKSLKTAEDYLVGGHKLKIVPVAVSLMASQLSTFSITVIPAETYQFGWQIMLSVPALILVMLLTNYVSLPVFYSNNIENCYVYLEMRFGKATRKILTSVFVILTFFFSPAIMYIPALAFAEVTKYNVHVINIILNYVCVIYTILGGIKAVVWTDVLQGFVMIGTIMLIAVLGLKETGGFTEVWDRAVEGGRIFPPIMSVDLTTRITLWNTILATFFMWTCLISFNQNCAQRLVSLPSLKNAKRAMYIFVIGMIILNMITTGTGIIMYSFYHGCDPVKAGIVLKADNLIPRFVRDVAGYIPGMNGIFISCMVSASLSHTSATIHAVSGVVYSDYIRPLKLFAHTDRNANLSLRLVIFLLGTWCAFGGVFLASFRSMFQILMTVSGVTNGAKLGVFTIAMLYPFANQKGVLTGIVVSVATMIAIVINTHVHHLQYTPIPTSIDQCSNEILAQIPYTNVTEQLDEIDDGFAFYKISFQWYMVIGAIMTWIPTMIVSYFTGGNDISGLDPKLFAPFIQKILPKKYHHTELKTIDRNIYSEKSKNDDNLKRELTGLMKQND